MKKCSVGNCAKDLEVKGLCGYHYRRAHPEDPQKVSKRYKGYYRKHSDKISKAAKQWQLNNPKKCKKIGRTWRLKHHYGLTLEQYDTIFQKQEGKCLICTRHQSELPTVLVVDHDHNCCAGDKSCGKCIRGLLCDGCNRGIGGFEDNIEALQNATVYLKGTKVTTAKELRDKLEIDLKVLQANCPHSETSWAHEAWAPAHLTGRQIRYCVCCEAHLEVKEAHWEPCQFVVDHNNDIPLNDIVG